MNDMIFISSREAKKVYIIRGFTFWNEYDMISLVYLIGDVSRFS